MEPIDLGSDDGMIAITWSVDGTTELGRVELDIDEAMSKLSEWRKTEGADNKPEEERSESLLRVVNEMGIGVRSRHQADKLVVMLSARHKELKKKISKEAEGTAPASLAGTASILSS